jgi:hypothetical protein
MARVTTATGRKAGILGQHPEAVLQILDQWIRLLDQQHPTMHFAFRSAPDGNF